MDIKNRDKPYIPFKVSKNIILANICMEMNKINSNLILGYDVETYPDYEFMVE